MNLVQICPYDISRPGGVQRHVLDLASALQRAGHDVIIAAPGVPVESQVHGVRFHSIGRYIPFRMHGTRFEVTWARASELDALLKHAPWDVAHFHTLWTPFIPWQIFRRVASRVLCNVCTFHDTPPPGAAGAVRRGAYRVMSRRLSMRLQAMVAVSASVSAHLRPRETCALYRLPPCIDLSRYFSTERKPLAAAPRVLFVGRLEPRKGVLLLIDAFSEVRARHPTAELIVCGDGEQRGAAEALAKARGVSGAVRFVGSVDEQKKLALHAEADILCAPSPYGESYGLVIAEAMASGLPVVAAANSGYRSVLTGIGASGLAKPGSASALAERLLAVLGSRALHETLSGWGRAEALRSDVNARLADFLAVYQAPAFSYGLASGYQRSSMRAT